MCKKVVFVFCFFKSACCECSKIKLFFPPSMFSVYWIVFFASSFLQKQDVLLYRMLCKFFLCSSGDTVWILSVLMLTFSFSSYQYSRPNKNWVMLFGVLEVISGFFFTCFVPVPKPLNVHVHRDQDHRSMHFQFCFVTPLSFDCRNGQLMETTCEHADNQLSF